MEFKCSIKFYYCLCFATMGLHVTNCQFVTDDGIITKIDNGANVYIIKPLM